MVLSHFFNYNAETLFTCKFTTLSCSSLINTVLLNTTLKTSKYLSNLTQCQKRVDKGPESSFEPRRFKMHIISNAKALPPR